MAAIATIARTAYGRYTWTRPGDRASGCFGLMEPVGIVRKHQHLQVVHCCTACGKIQPNRIARDTEQPDDLDLILELMRLGRPN